MYELINKQLYEWINKQLYEWKNEWRNRRINE